MQSREATVFGIANAVNDPELRYVGESNRAVCVVTLAFNRSYKVNDEWQTEATFLKSQVWGRKAEKLAEHVKKGTPVYVIGHLTQENWSTKEGEKRQGFRLDISEFSVVQKFTNGNGSDSKSNDEKQKSQQQPPETQKTTNATVPPSGGDVNEGDIPF